VRDALGHASVARKGGSDPGTTAWANVAAQFVNRIGVKPALIFGMSMLTLGPSISRTCP
jgi:hypothetical protein